MRWLRTPAMPESARRKSVFIIGTIVDRSFFRSEDGRGPAYIISVIVSEIVLGILASLIVLWLSRQREFRADRGGATLSGRANMIALEKLKVAHKPPLTFDNVYAGRHECRPRPNN